MVEQKYSASVENVYALLTDAKWLEQRCLELGELAVAVKAKKTSKGATLHMKRTIKRDLPALVAKVLASEGEMVLEEHWHAEDAGYSGTLTIELKGQPVKISADFELRPAGKGCVYSIQHHAQCGVPLIGGAVAKFALSELEKGCRSELDYLSAHLKKHK